jgi:hypothetical protein
MLRLPLGQYSAVQYSVCVCISQGLSIGRALQGWKNENVVREHDDGSRVICVTRRDEPRHVKKACRLCPCVRDGAMCFTCRLRTRQVDQIRSVVDQELGFASAADGTLPDTFKVCCVGQPTPPRGEAGRPYSTAQGL